MDNDDRGNMHVNIQNVPVKCDYIFRVCIIGDAGVGKTSILTRYCDDVFRENHVNTIGVDFRVITLNKGETTSKIHVWDTAGQERFRSISVNYFRNAHGFIFVYDVTVRNSFENISNWIKLASENNDNAMINFIIGNKCDLNKREVQSDEGREYAECKNMIFMETSAQNSYNIKHLFEYIGDRLFQYYSRNSYKSFNDINDMIIIERIDIGKDISKKNKCC
jgi:small GTP-binding protein